MERSLDRRMDSTERIGVVGSPSSTSELTLDILASAVARKLVGEFALFRFQQDGKPHYALGQIVEVRLRNVWHEDPTVRSLIRQRGRIDAISERQDVHHGEMTVSAVFCRDGDRYRPSILGTVPATGTSVHIVDDSILEELLAPYQSQLFYLGRVYGSTPKLPLWFKHFGSGPDGAGEAYHLGIFGKTGSGKSVLAKMILLAYARYPEMALLVLDPQGEFAKDLRGEPTGDFRLPMREVLKHLGKPVQVVNVRDLVLDEWSLFQKILEASRFFRELQVFTADKIATASEVLIDAIKEKGINLSDLYRREKFKECWDLLNSPRVRNRIYAREGEAAERFANAIRTANSDRLYSTIWEPIANLFRQDRPGAQHINRLLLQLLNPQGRRHLVVIDLSWEYARDRRTAGVSKRSDRRFERGLEKNLLLPLEHQDSEQRSPDERLSEEQEQEPALLWNETIQALVIQRILKGILWAAEEAYSENRSLNALILMDEAHRLAPREEPENPEKKAIRDQLIDAVRTTRKYGVGWMFISQTLSSLHRGIVDQLRIFFFGFGLGMGQEFRALSELVGGRSKALDLYQLFRDPHSAFDPNDREYSFMTTGPVSPLSFAGTPLFFNAFNRVEEFLEANGWSDLKKD
ncbi:ATP-binding protein [Thermoflexus sp.]|uniref:ATP-binding protein n=1 Tax=Thermoflexus sp. TaxID=1969742 RepID=UPI002ADD3D9D|nr:DUF87 domain-containing protein [Thermoflexus sp.]